MDFGNASEFMAGAWTTLWISAISVMAGIPLGLGLALLRITRTPVLTQIIGLYVSLGRATPIVTLVLFLFVVLPSAGIRVDREFAAIAALTLNTAAFNAEIWRSVYSAFPIAQIEAARAAGMTWLQYFRRIMLPQLWYSALPALINEITTLIKASPAIAVIGVVDLTRVSARIAANTYQPLPPLLVAGAIYMAGIYGLLRAQRAMERRAERFAS